MDLLLAPESFLLSERYASAVKTLGLAIFFMPVLPLSCVIALAGQPPQPPPHTLLSHPMQGSIMPCGHVHRPGIAGISCLQADAGSVHLHAGPSLFNPSCFEHAQ